MKIVVSHPTGNRNVREAISAFEAADLLHKFITTLAINPDSSLLNLVPEKLREELMRRSYPVSFDRILSRPLLEISRNLLPKLGYKGAVKHETGFASVDKVYADLDKRTASYLKHFHKKKHINTVYAYEDGAIHTFNVARHYGIQCIYDLPIGYWRAANRLLETELTRWPEWVPTLTGFRNSLEKLSHKDEELKLADRIFVASSFTAKTLHDYPGKLSPIEVIPYGFPYVIKERKYSKPTNRALKLLFVGGLTQRKGISYLFAAVKNIGKHVELTVVGKKTSGTCPALDIALAEHTWIPSLPHKEILNLMREHDVLIFPSLFEGFGLVITEAMSQGTPVITTERTAGPDLITPGKDGWVIEAGSIEALQTEIEKLLHRPELIAFAGMEAMETAKQRPWMKYGQELSEALIRNTNYF